METVTSLPFPIKGWITATFLGWLLGVVFIILLSSFLDGIGIEGMQFYLGVGMGGGVGLAQWFYFRKQGILDIRWIWTSVIGMGLPVVAFDLLTPGMEHKLAISIALGAFVTGLIQYLLFKDLYPKAYLWIPACLFGWTLAVATAFSVDYTDQLKVSVNNLLLAFINLLLILGGGIVLGVITGLTLKRIVQ